MLLDSGSMCSFLLMFQTEDEISGIAETSLNFPNPSTEYQVQINDFPVSSNTHPLNPGLSFEEHSIEGEQTRR